MDKSWLLFLLLLSGLSKGNKEAETLQGQTSDGISANEEISVKNQRQQPIPRPGVRVLDPTEVTDIIGTPTSAKRTSRNAQNGVPSPYLVQPSASTTSFRTQNFNTQHNSNSNNNNNNNNNFGQFSNDFNRNPNRNNDQSIVSNSNFDFQNQNFISNANDNNNGFANFNRQIQSVNNHFSNPNNEVSNYYKQFINNDENEIVKQLGNNFSNNFGNQNFKNGNYQFNLASQEDVHTDTDALNGVSFLSNDGINNFGRTGVILPEPEVIKLSPRETIILEGSNTNNNNNIGLPTIKQAIELHPGGNSQKFTVIRDNDDDISSFENFASQAGSFGLPHIPSSKDIGTNNAFSQQLFTIKSDDDNDDSFESFGIPTGGFVGPIPTLVHDNRESSVGPVPTPVKDNNIFIPSPFQGNGGSDVKPISASEIQQNTFNENNNIQTDSSNARNQFGIPLPTSIKQDNFQVDSVVDALNSISSGKTENIDNALGGITIGELLSGINGKNGIVVLPASRAGSLNLPSAGSKVSIRETSDEQIVVETPSISDSVSTATTTTESPVTRRISSRRKTTRAPDHLRRTLSDLLYAKGQWFGTLLGGVIDYGRIAYDAFNKNADKISPESYA